MLPRRSAPSRAIVDPPPVLSDRVNRNQPPAYAVAAAHKVSRLDAADRSLSRNSQFDRGRRDRDFTRTFNHVELRFNEIRLTFYVRVHMRIRKCIIPINILPQGGSVVATKKRHFNTYDAPIASLSRRVQQLVNHFFAGSVNAAATAWAIPQPTLHRIVDGVTKSPRAELLAKIAAAHSTTIEWLLSGSGEGPQLTRRTMGVMAPLTGHVVAWTELLDALDLAPQTKHAMTEAVFAPWWMFSILKPAQAAEHHESEEHVREAVESSAVAYITALRGLLESYGKDAVSGAIARQADAGRLWFNPFGAWLQKASVLPNDLTELYDSYLDYDKRCSEAEPGAEVPITTTAREPVRISRDKARVTEVSSTHRSARAPRAKRRA